jgi:hypothetical protein
MKKVLLSMAVIATFAMTSCGGDAMCECMEGRLEMRKQINAAGEDEAKIDKIRESFKAQKDECKDLGKKMRDDLGEEEFNKKIEEMEKSCSAVKELKDL